MTMSYQYPNILKKFSIIALIVLMLPQAVTSFFEIGPSIVDDFKVLHRSTSNDLFVTNYGYCNKVGVGYLRKIVPSIPDTEIFPVVRYGDWYRYPHVLFRDRRIKNDNRVLIGIDLHKNDIRETKITEAVMESADKTISTWLFHTGFDYELLTGYNFLLCDNSSLVEEKYIVTLYDSYKNYEEIGQWFFTIQNNNERISTIHLDEPISDFSFTRGATNFVLELKNITPNNSNKNICGIEILGVKIDIRDYTIFHLEENKKLCFSAIKNSFYQEIKNDDLTLWQNYLDGISNVDFAK
ncbi:MAG: hypothetical protein HN922_00290 [Anaerolineae bacterium]|jgi:hypothetical protein|nr:hypothetical protein [Anaerolineae bacterium]MBT7782235.1 hypothetical protein [Anaerolineae bacterium]